MKKLLAIAVIGGLLSVGCGSGTTKTTVKGTGGNSTISSKTSGGESTHDTGKSTVTEEKTSTKATEKTTGKK